MNKDDRSYQRTLVAAIDAELGVRRWSRRRLAEESGINSQTLDRVFLLRRDMNIEQLADIAAALGLEPEDIVTRARVWSERATPNDHAALVDEQSALTNRQKAALKEEVHRHSTQRSNVRDESDDVPSREVLPARERPSG